MSVSTEENKEIVGRWFTEFWGKDFNPGVTVLKVENGLITQEIGLDDGLTAVRQLGLIVSA